MTVPLVALLAALACADAGARGGGHPGGAGDEGRQAMRVVRGGRETAAVGEVIDLVVARPVGIPERLQCEWPSAPRVEGTAVRFVRRRVEAPPPEDDGGVATLHYELAAERPGSSRVTLVPKAAGPEATCREVTLEITVGAAPAR